MNMIITLAFLGILVHAFAEECELMPAAEEFDSEKYFSIPLVYVTHSRSRGKEDVCRKYQTTRNSDGTIETLVSGDYKEGDTSPKSVVKCINKPKNKGQFSVECEVLEGTGSNQKIQLETSVIATDNKNYAFLQRCSTSGLGDILVLQTNSSNVDPGVKKVFDLNKWNINEWSSRNSVVC
uniref:Salivary lipocalin n=1 Tax=Triatoma matogrossensis TaxID=162370 RepID=E2J745_9HEMI